MLGLDVWCNYPHPMRVLLSSQGTTSYSLFLLPYSIASLLNILQAFKGEGWGKRKAQSPSGSRAPEFPSPPPFLPLRTPATQVIKTYTLPQQAPWISASRASKVSFANKYEKQTATETNESLPWMPEVFLRFGSALRLRCSLLTLKTALWDPGQR